MRLRLLVTVVSAAALALACGGNAYESNAGGGPGSGAGGVWVWDLGVTAGGAAGATSAASGGAGFDPVGGAGGASGAAGAIVATGGIAGTPQIPLSPPFPDSSLCRSATNLPITGTWSGSIENATAPWDSIRLVIDGASDSGGLCGSMTLGSAPPAPPATDPDAGYPAGFQGAGGAPPLIEGFAFTLFATTVRSNRALFSIAAYHEPWADWCTLQTVRYPTGAASPAGGYGCAPIWASAWPDGGTTCELTDPDTGEGVAMDCGKLTLCQYPVCLCNATECRAAPKTDVSCDLVFTTTAEAIGTCTAAAGNARFFRVD
jgi:hypothetical protein